MTKNLIFGLLGILFLAAQANAGLLDQAEENPFLPVDEAFVLDPPSIRDGELVVQWHIADEYYLYQHRLGFHVTDPAGFSLGEASIPDGKQKFDEYFGQVEVYYHELTARIPIPASNSLPDVITLSIDYQGCADRGLCYPPQTRAIAVSTAGITTTESVVTPEADSSMIVSESDRLAEVILSGTWLAFSLQFFGLGLLLAFTPCILPMVPILSGVIVGLDQERKALKGFFLSVSYVVAMAAAYAFMGAAAGVFGQNIQAAMQAPAFIGVFSAIFVLLALAMFGVYRLQLPSAWQSRIHEWSSKHQGGTFLGAAAMGFFAALIVGPCLAPPLAGALLYIGQTGDPIRGATALFSMGLGMGLPLILLGTLEGRLLPKAGAWMERVNHIFGVILLGVAIWLLARVIPAQWSMTLWGALVIGSGLHMGALQRGRQSGWAHVQQALGLVAIIYGVMILIGGMYGSDDPLHPLPAKSMAQSTDTNHAAVEFQRIKTKDDLDMALAAALATDQPVMLDFYADWCVSCKHMEKAVFPAPAVKMQLDRITLLQADVTANDAEDRELMKHLEVMGPPTILFFNRQGGEERGLRLVGELDATAFSEHLSQFLYRQ